MKPCPKGHHGEAHVLQVLHHLDGSPAVEGDLADVVPLAEPLDELLDVAVVDDVALRGLEASFLLPDVVGHVVAPDALLQRVLRHPEVR